MAKASAALKARLKAQRKKFGLGEFRKAGKAKRRRSTRVVRSRTSKSRKVVRVARRKKVAKRSSSKVMKIGRMSITNKDLWEVGGIGIAASAGGLVNQFSGGRLAGNVAQGAAGLALGFFGGRRGADVGKGILKKTIGDLVEDTVVPRLTGLVGIGSSNSGSNTNSNGVVVVG